MGAGVGAEAGVGLGLGLESYTRTAAVDPARAFIILGDVRVEHPAAVGVPAIHRVATSQARECSAKAPPVHGVAALKGFQPPRLCT